MNSQQAERMRNGKGFIAALDQSGGSTPKALEIYGISRDAYSDDERMFDLVHEMRSRIITSPAFTSENILAAILFEQTMDRTVQGFFTGDYLWEKKRIIPLVKVDQGLAPESNGVQLMKPITNLESLLHRAIERKIFGTKMRSLIKSAEPSGIEQVVKQQFEYGRQIAAFGLIPIIEPEVDINIPEKRQAESLLKKYIEKQLDTLPEETTIMLKLTIPSEDGLYSSFCSHPRIMRVAALSGGYSRLDACNKLSKNPGLIASFSRALTEGLTAGQTDEEFDADLSNSVKMIYRASIT